MAIKYLRRSTRSTLRRIERTPEPYAKDLVYSNVRWVRASAAWLLAYPFCVLCLAHGRINQGAQDFASDKQRNLVVDHITPHRGNRDLFWDQDNWETLCRFPCHDKDKARIENQSKDWWHYVRIVMQEHKTHGFIEQHKQWIPEHVYQRLYTGEA